MAVCTADGFRCYARLTLYLGHCLAGSYCAKYSDGQGTCCFNNQTLAQCGVVARGATIAGGSSHISVPPSSSSYPISSSSSPPGFSSSSSPVSSSYAPPGGSSSVGPGGGSSHRHPTGPKSGPVPSSSGSVVCKPVENPTCERSCGPGWITCRKLPHCYNPSSTYTSRSKASSDHVIAVQSPIWTDLAPLDSIIYSYETSANSFILRL